MLVIIPGRRVPACQLVSFIFIALICCSFLICEAQDNGAAAGAAEDAGAGAGVGAAQGAGAGAGAGAADGAGAGAGAVDGEGAGAGAVDGADEGADAGEGDAQGAGAGAGAAQGAGAGAGAAQGAGAAAGAGAANGAGAGAADGAGAGAGDAKEKGDADEEDEGEGVPKPPKEAENCNGIFASYVFQEREREYPFVKNAKQQSWAFKAGVRVINMGDEELKSWQLYIKFQYDELLVTTDGAVALDGEGSDPINVGKNGTILAGYPQADLRTAIDTANDLTRMQAQIKIKGTQFGGNGKQPAMPKTIKLVNLGFKCPQPTRAGGTMHICCKKDPKFKDKKKFVARQKGDLDFTYDVLQASDTKYLAQVTMDNNHPLGRLDQWNLTWQWMRNEFIYSMRGAYTPRKSVSDCIFGPQAQYYKDFDFSQVMNCEKWPVITDLPSEKENDEKIGKLPYCCKTGILLPKTLNKTKSRAKFQLEVFKLPPDMDRKSITPPQNWKIVGRLNPSYKCDPPTRVDPSEFPDPMGLDATITAIASWQVTCKMIRPKLKQSKCCVSYSAYYSDTAIPCNTCACGCDADIRESDAHCDANAPSMVIPSNALLVPFANRTGKAKAFARIKHHRIPKKLPCADNCGVTINWHIDSNYKNGWTARVTLFNWEKDPYADWFTAVQLKESYSGYVKAHSFNATKVDNLRNTIIMQGLPGLNYLVGETDSLKPKKEPPIPGKQQTVITFTKKDPRFLTIREGDGFPSKIYFNGEQCVLPRYYPTRNSAIRGSPVGMIPTVVLVALTYMLLATGFN